MENRIAVISVIVEEPASTDALNFLLSSYKDYIVGRMGIPYKACDVSIICVAVDAPQDVIAALSGKIGSLTGISSKTAYSNVIHKTEGTAC